MSESSVDKTKRKFQKAIIAYQPTHQTIVQFKLEALPNEVIEVFTKLRKKLSERVDSVLVFWLATFKSEYGEKYGCFYIFSQRQISEELILKLIKQFTEHSEYIHQVKSKRQWTEQAQEHLFNRKEIYDRELFREFYQLANGEYTNRLGITNKNKFDPNAGGFSQNSIFDDDLTH